MAREGSGKGAEVRMRARMSVQCGRASAVRHVVASAIFFDGCLALGARLSVGDKPIIRLRIVAAFHQPILQVGARGGLMVVVHALEAEALGAGTLR